MEPAVAGGLILVDCLVRVETQAQEESEHHATAGTIQADLPETRLAEIHPWAATVR